MLGEQRVFARPDLGLFRTGRLGIKSPILGAHGVGHSLGQDARRRLIGLMRGVRLVQVRLRNPGG